jgi:hypothetical protein
MATQRPGRVRTKLAELLTAAGYACTAEMLRPQQGVWRTDDRFDVCRWEGEVVETKTARVFLIQSWSTMSDCVKSWLRIAPDERNYSYLTVEAK